MLVDHTMNWAHHDVVVVGAHMMLKFQMNRMNQILMVVVEGRTMLKVQKSLSRIQMEVDHRMALAGRKFSVDHTLVLVDRKLVLEDQTKVLGDHTLVLVDHMRMMVEVRDRDHVHVHVREIHDVQCAHDDRDVLVVHTLEAEVRGVRDRGWVVDRMTMMVVHMMGMVAHKLVC